jgi:flavin-dependent dehydrogenase
MESLYDVAIIGGGPAGSTAATFLARLNRKVIILEKDKFPRFHIGESLLPYSMGAFERLGIREKMDAQFQPKHGGEITSSCGAGSAKFYFKNGFRLQHHQAYQVTRSEFDKMMLDLAAAGGAEVLQETSVESLEFGDEDVGVTFRNNGINRNLRARYILDCSGRSTVIGNFFQLKRGYANLKKFSVFAHYENVAREEGIDGTLIRLVRASDRWFWMIPLNPTKMSVGMVMDIANYKAMKKSPEEALEESLRGQPAIWNRMTRSERVTPFYSAGDYSYRNTSLAGDRWLLAGDAAGFIDPIFSTGVYLAIRSGEDAANTLDTVLKDPNRRPVLFRKYERGLNRVMKMYLRFVTNWYKPQFIEVITHPAQRFQLAPAVNAVLAGNISGSFAIWWRMQLFYLVVFLQRYIPLCPRLSLVPENSAPAPSVTLGEPGHNPAI